jgi:quercetin dioxygenase-like cupin family protein
MPGENRVEIHLGSRDTADAFCLVVDHPPPGWFLPPHRHMNEAETIYVIDGEFEMHVDGRASTLAAGETLHIPRAIVHSSRNVGTTPGRRVLIFSPAGVEEFFREAGVASSGTEPDAATVAAAAARHGMVFVGS